MFNRNQVVLLLVAVLAGMASPAFASSPNKPASQASLYKRLGGHAVVAAIADEVFSHALVDPQLKNLFRKSNAAARMRARKDAVNVLSTLTGGPSPYTKKDLKEIYPGIGVSDSDWILLMNYLRASLERHKVPAKERAELITIFQNEKPDIVLI